MRPPDAQRFRRGERVRVHPAAPESLLPRCRGRLATVVGYSRDRAYLRVVFDGARSSQTAHHRWFDRPPPASHPPPQLPPPSADELTRPPPDVQPRGGNLPPRLTPEQERLKRDYEARQRRLEEERAAAPAAAAAAAPAARFVHETKPFRRSRDPEDIVPINGARLPAVDDTPWMGPER